MKRDEKMFPKPFSNKIIFVDTEFSELDPYSGELLSIGMIKMSGEELYLELEYNGEVSGFVKECVLPHLSQNKTSREEAKKIIFDFVGKDKPFMVASVISFDTLFLHKLLGFENNPFNWIPIDFPSMLFAAGIDPERDHHGEDKEFYKKFDLDKSKYKKHHALEDARFLRDAYLKFFCN